MLGCHGNKKVRTMSATPTLATVTEVHPAPYAQSVNVSGHTFAADEPEHMNGYNTGPAPYDLLCAALGCCTNMTLRMYATQKGWPVTHIETVVTHEKITDDVNLKRDVFTRTIKLNAPELTEEQRQRLLEIADKCPVSRTLQNTAQITDTLA
ncbi:MAG: OsmC family protein [Blastochloris viridis]|uniref:OsmC family protein n=1 Tax=Blastochloris viridis TaxID=1079 RepID=A0A6N4RC23_BLAVI|nr:MAG: OsmC family protein [Blastochloris viridis]